jgi:hypothetical protein
MTPTSTYMLRPFTAVTRVRIPLGSLSMLRRANQLQQRIYSPSQSASIKQWRRRYWLHFAISRGRHGRVTGPAVTWDTCSNSLRQIDPYLKFHLQWVYIPQF